MACLCFFGLDILPAVFSCCFHPPPAVNVVVDLSYFYLQKKRFGLSEHLRYAFWAHAHKVIIFLLLTPSFLMTRRARLDGLMGTKKFMIDGFAAAGAWWRILARRLCFGVFFFLK